MWLTQTLNIEKITCEHARHSHSTLASFVACICDFFAAAIFASFAIFAFCFLSQSIDNRVFDEGSEHEDEAGGHPYVDGLRDRSSRHAPEHPGTLCGDREYGQDAERRPGWSRFQVNPEGQPGQEDDQETRKVCGEDVCFQSTLQVEGSSQTWKRSFKHGIRSSVKHLVWKKRNGEQQNLRLDYIAFSIILQMACPDSTFHRWRAGIVHSTDGVPGSFIQQMACRD